MLTAELKRPHDLTPGELSAWRGLARATPGFDSPLMGPEFAAAVGRVRSDAAVAVFRRAGDPVGFFPHHRRPGGLARPIGAPFSDRHAVVSAPDLPVSGRDLLSAARLKVFRYTGLVDPLGVFEGGEPAGQCHLVNLTGSAEAHLEAIRAASPKKFKNYRRLEHKLEREVGPVTLVAQDFDRAAFCQLMTWKRAQLRRSGLLDFLRSDWTRTLMTQLFETREGGMQGLLVTLRAGGRLVAGHFGVRLGDAYHPWVAAADPALSAYSPGHLFLQRAIRAMPQVGLVSYDLSSGHDHYKAQYATTRLDILQGSAKAPAAAPLLDQLRAAAFGAASALSGRHAETVRRAERRLEHIAAVELSLPGRLMGLVETVAGVQRRNAYLAQAAEAHG